MVYKTYLHYDRPTVSNVVTEGIRYLVINNVIIFAVLVASSIIRGLN
jgi:hypothetical protein